ncbi:hypothetical protein [Actinomadura macrotermitis]|uniref:Uncharacterized protein n=1 Tax=Actinomadura macrotermitis TaxID=2585200 RepID=A0A7K0BMY1_9ACTN|nr:hypothetical protein [Actinomadura macrotermitis]MQY02232.1 hypothetical protein [Actinomadura macrotermitis]
MTRIAVWLGKNADAVIALLLALVVAVLGLGVDMPNEDEIVNSATLAVIGLLATSVLRDRGRREPVETEVRASLRESSQTLGELSGRLAHMDRFEQVVDDARRALDEASVVRVLSRAQLDQVLTEARRSTDRWHYKGGTGRYLRTRTLPECVAAARRERRTLLMRVEIVDPADEQVCETFARHRDSLPEGPGGTAPQDRWTADRVRKEVYATVLAACWYRQRFAMLDIDVGLSRAMTTIRYDLSASLIAVTRDDPAGDVLIVDAGRFYYGWCATELQTSLEQARRVPIEQARLAPLGDEPTLEEVRKLFEVLNLPLPRGYTDRDVIEIVRKALRPAP